jgi:hypothetical protein
MGAEQAEPAPFNSLESKGPPTLLLSLSHATSGNYPACATFHRHYLTSTFHLIHFATLSSYPVILFNEANLNQIVNACLATTDPSILSRYLRRLLCLLFHEAFRSGAMHMSRELPSTRDAICSSCFCCSARPGAGDDVIAETGAQAAL